MKNTATPWRIEGHRLAGATIKSTEAAPRTIAQLLMPFPHLMTADENLANAELIVKAVNEHAALVAVAEAAKVISDNYTQGDFDPEPLDSALAALAAVRAGQSQPIDKAVLREDYDRKLRVFKDAHLAWMKTPVFRGAQAKEDMDAARTELDAARKAYEVAK